jgi:hypothetical protein
MHKVKKETNEKKTTFLESSYFARRGVSPRKQSFFD